MANYMFGGGFLNSRLAVRIRQKDGLSYGVASQLNASSLDKAGGFGAFAIYNPGNSAKLVTAYREEIARMLASGFTDDELRDARSGWLQSRNVTRSQDRSLAAQLTGLLYLGRTIEWDAELERKVAGLKVTDVNAAVQRWIKPDSITIVEAGDFASKGSNRK